MRVLRPAVLLVLCSLIPASLSAQQSASTATPQPVSDPQAVALMQKALMALTGGAPVADVTLTGTARRIAGSDDETGTATLTATAAGDSKLSLNFPSGPRTEIRNHAAMPLPGALPPNAPASARGAQPVGAWSGPDGTLHPVAANNLLTDTTWFFPAATLVRLATAPNYVISYVGQETLNDRAVVHISARQYFSPLSQDPVGIANLMQHLSQMELYLDASSLLPVGLAFNTHPDDNALVDITTEIRYSDYRAVSGAQISFRVQKYINNGLALDFQFNDVTLNSGLTAAQFQLQ